MLLNYCSFPKMLLMIGLSFVFLKIYQHNLVIKLNYEGQRLEKKRAQLEREKNDLSVELATLREPEKVLTKAKEQWGMKVVRVDFIRGIAQDNSSAVQPDLISQGFVDFLGTTSRDDVLKKVGLYDLIVRNTRG